MFKLRHMTLLTSNINPPPPPRTRGLDWWLTSTRIWTLVICCEHHWDGLTCDISMFCAGSVEDQKKGMGGGGDGVWWGSVCWFFCQEWSSDICLKEEQVVEWSASPPVCTCTRRNFTWHLAVSVKSEVPSPRTAWEQRQQSSILPTTVFFFFFSLLSHCIISLVMMKQAILGSGGEGCCSNHWLFKFWLFCMIGWLPYFLVKSH